MQYTLSFALYIDIGNKCLQNTCKAQKLVQYIIGNKNKSKAENKLSLLR